VRAWQVQSLGEPRDALRLVELEPPEPGAGEVRLRVTATALGLPDAFMCRGVYAFSPALPFVPGQEVCGVVDAVGAGVDLPLGTRVMGVTSFTDGRGGFAELTIAPAAGLYRVPDAMSDTDAAGFRIGMSTAWIGLVRRAQLQAGEHLLVLGAAGGSGAAAVQLGRALGARVIAVVSGAEKGAYCAELGADIVIDRTVGPVADAVNAVTDGRGADVIYDPVGGDAAQGTWRCLATEGRFCAVGFASGSWVQVDTHQAVVRNHSLVGVYAGGYTRAQNEQDHEALLAFVERGAMTGGVTRTFAFEDLPLGLEAVAAGVAIGKTALLGSGRAVR
jgi:NADPH2:quinone reductase